MVYKCYMCNREIKGEHFFLVGFKGRSRILCRKCGVKLRKKKYSEKEVENGNVDGR